MPHLLLTLILLHGCDATTTTLALQRGHPELNPVLTQNVVMNVGLQTAFTSAQVLALARLHTTHPKWATVLAVVALSVEASVVAHNLQTLQR